MTPKDCHPGRARGAKIRDRGVNSELSAVPDRRSASLSLSGMTAFFGANPDVTPLLLQERMIWDAFYEFSRASFSGLRIV
jgi:hypothetical protein